MTKFKVSIMWQGRVITRVVPAISEAVARLKLRKMAQQGVL